MLVLGLRAFESLNWNPKRAFKWTENADESARTRREESVHRDWSTGGTKRIVPGDRIFVGKQGVEPKGVIASGYANSPVFEKAHFGDASKQTTYNRVRFDAIVDPESVLPRSELLKGALGGINWDSEKGGITINREAAAFLEEKWQDWLNKIGFGSTGDLEVQSAHELFGEEGKLRLEFHKMRERDSSIVRAKKRIAWSTFQKLACEICEFDFAKRYGQQGENYIECHHRTPLRDVDREMGRRTQLDDLALVCANCHRMLHRGNWPSVDELRSVLAAQH